MSIYMSMMPMIVYDMITDIVSPSMLGYPPCCSVTFFAILSFLFNFEVLGGVYILNFFVLRLSFRDIPITGFSCFALYITELIKDP